MEYSNPLVIQIANIDRKTPQIGKNSLVFPADVKYVQFKNVIEKELKTQQYDYVMLNFNNDVVRTKDNLQWYDKMSELVTRSVPRNSNIPTVTVFQGVLYQLNPTYKEGKPYAPSDDTVMAKYNLITDNGTNPDAWADHQYRQYNKLGNIMPLQEGKWGKEENHLALLTDPKRGLTPQDLNGYSSWKPFKAINPQLLKDDMVGMPAMQARKTDDVYHYGDITFTGAIHVNTTGQAGYVIPMRDPKGRLQRAQIGTDVTLNNVELRPRAADGVSIKKSEIIKDPDPEILYNDQPINLNKFRLQAGQSAKLEIRSLDDTTVYLTDKFGDFQAPVNEDLGPILAGRGYKLPEGTYRAHQPERSRYSKVVYDFNLVDGTPSNMTLIEANKDYVTIQDVRGQFRVGMKDDLKPLLEARGYVIPEMIATLKPTTKAKYLWHTPGTFIGKDQVAKTVAPANAGFIPIVNKAREDAGTTLLVVEGALKGSIVAKYATSPDANGQTLANQLVGANGNKLVVVQVPGVAKAFIESVRNYYPHENVTDVVIAMDADGRTNKSVAKGIHDSYEVLAPGVDAQGQPYRRHVEVMSWDPEQKGLDDALLAVGRGELTIDRLGLTFGSPDQLFPLDQAQAPNPYLLDGTRANDTWQGERDARRKEIRATQALAQATDAPEVGIGSAQPVMTEQVPPQVPSTEPIQSVISDLDSLMAMEAPPQTDFDQQVEVAQMVTQLPEEPPMMTEPIQEVTPQPTPQSEVEPQPDPKSTVPAYRSFVPFDERAQAKPENKELDEQVAMALGILNAAGTGLRDALDRNSHLKEEAKALKDYLEGMADLDRIYAERQQASGFHL